MTWTVYMQPKKDKKGTKREEVGKKGNEGGGEGEREQTGRGEML